MWRIEQEQCRFSVLQFWARTFDTHLCPWTVNLTSCVLHQHPPQSSTSCTDYAQPSSKSSCPSWRMNSAPTTIYWPQWPLRIPRRLRHEPHESNSPSRPRFNSPRRSDSTSRHLPIRLAIGSCNRHPRRSRRSSSNRALPSSYHRVSEAIPC